MLTPCLQHAWGHLSEGSGIEQYTYASVPSMLFVDCSVMIVKLKKR